MSNSLRGIFKNKKISIVGNAESIFTQKNGKIIDSADIVCRINKGIFIKNKESQGEKTDVWAYGDFSLVEKIYNNFNCPTTIHLSENKRSQKSTQSKTKYFYPLKNLNLLKNKLKWNYPSSGLMLLDLIFNCHPLDIVLYGFDWKKTPTWHNSIEENNLKNVHNWKLEEKLINDFYLKHENVGIIS